MRSVATMRQGGSGGSGAAERPRPKDPHLGMQFWVQIEGVEVAGFSECSGLVIETETFEYAEGGLNLYTHKLPVRTRYGNVVLRRGLDPAQDLYSWYMSTLDGKTSRKNLSIIIYGPTGEQVRQWALKGAYPVKWTGPDLRADAGAIAVETLEFAHEGLVPI